VNGSFLLLTDAANAVATGLDPNFVLNTGAHSHTPWSNFSIDNAAIAVNPINPLVIGTSASPTPYFPGTINGAGTVVGSGMHTHTLGSSWTPTTIEALPDGTSVRFKIGERSFTGEIVSKMEDTPGVFEPIYVVQPDNPLPKSGEKPIALLHSRVERINLLQRLTEAVWAPEG